MKMILIMKLIDCDLPDRLYDDEVCSEDTVHQCAIAVATTEADEAIASSDFLKIIGISPQKGANQGDSGRF